MKHPIEINYEGGLEKLAEDLGNLRYDILRDFFGLLAEKLEKDSKNDAIRNRNFLALELSRASFCLKIAKSTIDNAWKISEPFINKENHGNSQCSGGS